jgi:hypothetical protein
MEPISTLARANNLVALESRLSQYSKSKLLLIDELGYLPLERDAANLFSQLISRCYEGGSVQITSNRPVMEWGEVFGDQGIATAVLDRLLHHSHVLTVAGRQLPPAREAPLRSDLEQQCGEHHPDHWGRRGPVSIPVLPTHPQPQRLMSKTYRRRLRRQPAGAEAPKGAPDFVLRQGQFRMSLDSSTTRG